MKIIVLLVVLAIIVFGLYYWYRDNFSDSVDDPYTNGDLRYLKSFSNSCSAGRTIGGTDAGSANLYDSFKPHNVDFLGNDMNELYYNEPAEERYELSLHGQ